MWRRDSFKYDQVYGKDQYSAYNPDGKYMSEASIGDMFDEVGYESVIRAVDIF